MNQTYALGFYTLAILGGALAGGALPLVGRWSRSDALLSFSAGVMLGASFFHMLPEAVEGAGRAALPFVAVGFLVLFLMERFVLVHACAEPGPNGAELEAGAQGTAAPHAHVHGDGTGCEVHTLGLAAFVGLSLHTLIDGFALGASSARAELGMLVFLAILAHKIPNAFSLSAILRHEGYSRTKALVMNAAFALTIPLGAGLYLLLRDLVRTEAFTSFALAASAGTFLHLAFSDILPDVHRRNGARLSHGLALLAGLGAMWALRFVHGGA
jgi:zinc and cadmium transporter